MATIRVRAGPVPAITLRATNGTGIRGRTQSSRSTGYDRGVGSLLLLLSMLLSFGAPLITIPISLIYFIACSHSLSLRRRLLASAHGVSIACLYFGGLGVYWIGKADPSNTDPYWLFAVIPAAFILVSFYAFQGPKRVHYLQILNLLCLMGTISIGLQAVSGKWYPWP
jgi:hypothetical protein